MLRYPDDTFDAVFSSGSIEHFGGLDLVANAAFEMGRVVRPGGLVTLATEFKIAGPAGDGWEPGTLILDAERIQRYIVEASGLEPVDPLRTTLSERTLRSERDLTAFLEGARALSDGRPGPGGYPNVVLLHEGYLFCSVHLALRKPDAYPVSDNRWARPGAGAERAVAEGVREVERQLIAVRSRALERQPTALEASAHPELEALLAEWDMYWSGVISSRIARRLPGPLASLYRAYLRVRYLGPAWHAESRLLHVLARLVRSRQEDESALLRRELDDLRSDLRDLEARLREQQATPGETERPRAR
jgi:SAM-dependent methyltransferase